MPLPRHVAHPATALIGSTPVVRLTRMPALVGLRAEIWAKLEHLNPAGSVKDRIALAMIEAARDAGALRPGGTIVEATSGNTGLGLALVAAIQGYRLVLTMPDTMSRERQALLRGYGARLELVPDTKGMHAALARAEALLAEHPDWYMPRQFENPVNPEVHRRTTAREILQQVPHVRAFVAGVGTGGTITGVGSVLHAERPGTVVVAVEPATSPVLSGGAPGFHGIEGIGAGFVPPILDRTAFDRIVTVEDAEAIDCTRALARHEGLLVGISSGANCAAAIRIARELDGGAVVTVCCDTGQRYLSTEVFDARAV
jgi:cysteine synthase A